MRTCIRILTTLGALALAPNLAAGAPASSEAPLTFCMHTGTDPADREAIIHLYDAIAFDRRLNMVTRRLDADALHELQRGLQSGRPAVQLSAVVLLASVLPHDAIPLGEPLESIARAVATIIEAEAASTATDSLRLHARRVQWHLRLRSITDPAERAAFLAPRLHQAGADGVYYAYASVDYLAELGADGESVLRALVAEGAKRSIDSEIMGRTELGLQKIELSRQLARSGPATAVRALVAAAKTPTQRQMDREFGKWVVGLLAARRPEADSELRALADDASVTYEVQFAARLALRDDAQTIPWQ